MKLNNSNSISVFLPLPISRFSSVSSDPLFVMLKEMGIPWETLNTIVTFSSLVRTYNSVLFITSQSELWTVPPDSSSVPQERCKFS